MTIECLNGKLLDVQSPCEPLPITSPLSLIQYASGHVDLTCVYQTNTLLLRISASIQCCAASQAWTFWSVVLLQPHYNLIHTEESARPKHFICNLTLNFPESWRKFQSNKSWRNREEISALNELISEGFLYAIWQKKVFNSLSLFCYSVSELCQGASPCLLRDFILNVAKFKLND